MEYVMNELTLWVVSWIFTIVFYAVYLWSVFKWETKPHIYSAFLYFLLCIMPFYLQLQNNAWFGAVYFGISTFFWGLIFLLSFKYWFEGITRSDKIALILAVFVWIFWLLTQNAFYSVMLIIIVDVFSSYPTVRKTYFHPETENRYAYLIEAVWILASVFALVTFDFINAAHLIYVIAFDLLMFGIVFMRRR